MELSVGLAFGDSSASGMYVLIRIPGLAASQGNNCANLCSLVKSEPDEINNSMEQHQL